MHWNQDSLIKPVSCFLQQKCMHVQYDLWCPKVCFIHIVPTSNNAGSIVTRPFLISLKTKCFKILLKRGNGTQLPSFYDQRTYRCVLKHNQMLFMNMRRVFWSRLHIWTSVNITAEKYASEFMPTTFLHRRYFEGPLIENVKINISFLIRSLTHFVKN